MKKTGILLLCGAIALLACAARAAATILVDDPLFGPFVYGGTFERTAAGCS